MTATDTRSVTERMREIDAKRADLAQRSKPTDDELERFVELETSRALTAGESERYARTLAAASKFAEEAAELRRAELDLIREASGIASHAQSGDGAASGPEFMRRGGDPWEAGVERSSPQELKDRAMYAMDRSAQVDDDMAGIVDGLLKEEHDVTSVGARWAIATSRPQYRAAFQKFLHHPTNVAMILDDRERAAYAEVETVRAAWAEGTTTTGGFAVPAEYDLAMMIQNASATNPFRAISKVVQTSSNVWKGITSAGVTAEWMTESTEMSDATPAIGQPSITVYKADAYLTASFEVVQDSNLANEVMTLVADAKNRLEATAFAVGTGGGQPYGVVSRIASGARVAGSSGAAGAADFVLADVYALDNALPDRYYANASWVGHRST